MPGFMPGIDVIYAIAIQGVNGRDSPANTVHMEVPEYGFPLLPTTLVNPAR